MVSLTSYALVLLLLIALTYILLAKARGARFAYLCLFWIPPASHLLMYVFQEPIERTLSYGVVALLLMAVFLSIIFGVIGTFLFLRAFKRGETYIALIAATLLASLPAIIFAVELASGR